jgi:hypothetical protein
MKMVAYTGERSWKYKIYSLISYAKLIVYDQKENFND